MNTRIITVFIFILFLHGCGTGDKDSVPEISTGDMDQPVEFKRIDGTGIVPKITVNDAIELDMLVDTGSSDTYVPSGIFGNPDGKVHIESLCFENNVCFHDFMVRSSDSSFTQTEEGYLNGIIGMDLLQYFDLTYDYKSKSIYFNDVLEGDAEITTVPIHYQSGRPFADISIEGVPQGAILLDTGAAFTRITSEIQDSLDQNPETLFTTVVFNYDSSETVEYVTMKEYCVDSACPDEMIVQIGNWSAIGGTFFREYLTVFNFSENVVTLQPYSDRNHIKESGIQRIGIQVDIIDASEIIYVIPESPAWNGGIRAGCKIISVNQVPIESIGYLGIYDMLADGSIDQYDFLIDSSADGVSNYIISMEEARRAADEAMKINPKFSLKRFEKIIPYKVPEVKKRFIDALRNAVIPE